jgi:glycosyltransferase involved in cell wall biosynthesis
MKILQAVSLFFPSFSFGGPVRVSYEISKELAKRGHKVTVFTTDAYDRKTRLKITCNYYTIDGIRIKYFKNVVYNPRVHFFIAPELVREVKREIRHSDIIHLHDYRSFLCLVVTYYAKRYGIPYVLQAHGQLPRTGSWRKLKWLYDALFGYRLLRDASKVVALTRIEAEQYRSMGVPKEKIAIIPNGIDLSEYVNLPLKGSFKRKFGIPEDRKIILYLGRIHKIKGIDFLVKAYAHLIKETNFRDAVLVIAGPDDGYLSEVKSLVHDLSVSNSVLFTGLLSEKDKIRAYVDSDVVVNVEPLNVYGLVPLEAAACSAPVIVSKTNAISEVVLKGKFGFSVKYGDVISLASMLHRVLNDEELTENLGKNGRKYVLDNLGWDKIVEKYEQVYEKVTKC